MNRRIDWLNHALEFSVVLIGILIAFQLNTCSQNRSQADLVENHLTQIHQECEINATRIEESIGLIEQQIATCENLLSLLEAAKDPSGIRDQATTLLDLRNVDMKQSAYKVLVESGDIHSGGL